MTLRPVYSIQIMALAPALPTNTVVVPDGSRIILRDVDAVEAGFVSGASCWVENAAAGQLVNFTRTDTTHVAQFQWRGRQVYNPGQSIVVHVQSGDWEIQLSGYELSLT